MATPLADLTVVELSGDIATRYCGKLFAEHGARVIAAYAPANDRLAYGGASAAAYAAWLDAGKEMQSTQPAGITPDIVIAGQTPADVASAGASIASFTRRPLLVGLTWFGNGGPRALWQGSDAIVQAISGAAFPIGPAEGPPTLPQGHAPQVVGGITAFIAAMAALIGRRHGHTTDRVDTSVLEAFLCLTEGGAPGFAAGGPVSKRHGVNRFGPVYPQTIFAAADGWIGVTALTPLQWQELCAVIGLPDLAQDPRYETTDLRMAAADELEAVLVPAFRKLRAGDLLLEGQRRRVPLAPVPTMAEVLKTPHWRERQSFRHVTGAMPTFEAPAMPFRLNASGKGAALAGAPGTTPLAGIRVLDLSMGWSGPLAARHFADLGAEVIKVEGCSHIDWWRGWNALVAADPPLYEMRSNFNAMNRNKRGIAVELRSPGGADVLRRLAADADLLIENYAPGVLSKLGFSPEAMARINPRISYISMGAFGSSGPWSGFRAYGSTTEQAAGMPFLQGAADWAPTMQHTAYGDPIAGIYAAAAALTALWGRVQTGGTTIDLSQVECLFQLAADGLIAQSATGEPPPRTGSARATSLFRGCLRCNGSEDWLAVDIDGPERLAALSRTTGVAMASPAQVEAGLAGWAAERTSARAAELLQRAGIAAGPVLPSTGLLADPHLTAIGFWWRAERRHVGSHVLPRPPYALDGVSPPLRCPAPTLGQHNAEVLQQVLHMNLSEIEALERAGVIGTVAT